MSVLNCCEAGDARLEEENPAFFGCVKGNPRGGLRAGADDAHFASQDVGESGQLVELRSAEEASDACDAGIALSGDGGAEFLRVSDHRAELYHAEWVTASADALAEEKDGAGRSDFHGECQKQKNRRKKDQDAGRENDVEKSFGTEIPRRHADSIYRFAILPRWS